MPKKKAKVKLPPNRDSAHMAEIGRRGGKRTAKKKGKAFFRKIARMSHPVNNPDAQRSVYKGGRKRNTPLADSATIPK